MDDEERMAEELLEHREKLAKKKEVADAERQGLEEELEREQKKMRVHEQQAAEVRKLKNQEHAAFRAMVLDRRRMPLKQVKLPEGGGALSDELRSPTAEKQEEGTKKSTQKVGKKGKKKK